MHLGNASSGYHQLPMYLVCRPMPYVRSSNIQLSLARCAASQVTKALSDTNLIISGATAASLALGRFVLLPVQRRFNNKAGLPQQNGVSNAEAGDRQA